jgi:hypothetical protein
MIILPSTPGLRAGQPREVDPGFVQRSVGGALQRVDRAGLKFACEFTLPPMRAETARTFIPRLLRAKSEGIRLPWPLMGVSQGSPGNPEVASGGATGGTTLAVQSATSGYQVKEGYWLNVIDNDGVHCLHTVTADVTLSMGAGHISVWPPLRADLVAGNLVVLDAPKFEGLVTSEITWPAPYTKIVRLSFEVEEAL